MSSAPRDLRSVDSGRSVRLPRGVRDYLPEAAARRRAIAEAVLAETERWGYRRIVTPAFEYEAVLARGLGPGAQARAVRFVEPGTGEVVMLRPDITPQVARLVATRLGGEPGPLRLGYEGAVVRLAHGGQRELFQAGVELIDAGSPEGDVEVIALAAAALTAAGVSRFVLDLGCAPLARAALAGLPAAAGEGLRAAIARKDPEEVDRLAAALAGAIGLPAWRRTLLTALPGLYGGPEVLGAAARLIDGADAAASGVADARAGLRSLEGVVARLHDLGLDGRVTLDLGEVRGFDYYTGVRFSGYAPGVGDAILSGGRYDHLLERYGREAAAAGFAIDVERVAMALPDEHAEPSWASGVYLCGEPAVRHPVARALRAAAVRVVEDLGRPAGPGGLDAVAAEAELAARARQAGSALVVQISSAGGRWFAVTGSNHPGAADPDRGVLAVEQLAALLGGGEALDAIVPSRYRAAPVPAAAPGRAAGPSPSSPPSHSAPPSSKMNRG